MAGKNMYTLAFPMVRDRYSAYGPNRPEGTIQPMVEFLHVSKKARKSRRFAIPDT
jgi:hypothetical protein